MALLGPNFKHKCLAPSYVFDDVFQIDLTTLEDPDSQFNVPFLHPFSLLCLPVLGNYGDYLKPNFPMIRNSFFPLEIKFNRIIEIAKSLNIFRLK